MDRQSLAVGFITLALSAAVVALPAGASPLGENTAKWTTVRQLEPGIQVYLTRRGGTEVKVYLLRADLDGLWILNLSDPALSPRVREGLARLGPGWERAMDRLAVQVFDDVEIRAGGAIFEGGRQISDLDHVIEQVPRSEVQLVTGLDNRRTRRTAVAALACVSSAIVYYSLAREYLYYEEDLNKAAALATAVAVGPPLLTYAVTDRREVIYRAPARAEARLEAATMRRLVASLPPAFRVSDRVAQKDR